MFLITENLRFEINSCPSCVGFSYSIVKSSSHMHALLFRMNHANLDLVLEELLT
jgi:hypothetical protein